MSPALPRRRRLFELLHPRKLSDTARLLTATGARGELLIAWMRLLLVLAAMPAVAGRLIAMPGDSWSRRALALALAALLYALAVVALCRLGTCGAWLGYATAVVRSSSWARARLSDRPPRRPPPAPLRSPPRRVGP